MHENRSFYYQKDKCPKSAGFISHIHLVKKKEMFVRLGSFHTNIWTNILSVTVKALTYGAFR